MLYCIISERLEVKRDLSTRVEKIAMKLGPKAVLHNLSFSHNFAKYFDTEELMEEFRA